MWLRIGFCLLVFVTGAILGLPPFFLILLAIGLGIWTAEMDNRA
jgi:hypothetical protein